MEECLIPKLSHSSEQNIPFFKCNAILYRRIHMRAPVFPTPTNPVNTHPLDLISALILLSHVRLDLQVISSLHAFRLNFCLRILLFWYGSLIIFGE